MMRRGSGIRFRLLAAGACLLLTACGSSKTTVSPSREYEQKGDEAYFGQNMEAAIDNYKNALQAGSTTTSLHNNLGNSYFKERRFNAAEQSYLDALDMDPEYLFSLNNLAVTLYHAGDREEAKRLIGEAKKSFPDVSFLRTTEGYLHHLEGDRKKALQSFREAVEINPDSPAALNNLGVLYLENPGLGVDPLPYLKRAIESGSDNMLFHDSLGWYYYQKGMFADATIEIGKAFLYDPQNVEVRIHYATVLEWIGKDRESLEQWEAILQQAEDGATRKLALEHVWEIRGRGVGQEGPG
jgi:tetratricopeptide (TPR) repeat protein